MWSSRYCVEVHVDYLSVLEYVLQHTVYSSIVLQERHGHVPGTRVNVLRINIDSVPVPYLLEYVHVRVGSIEHVDYINITIYHEDEY